jgi:signal transduction histidine kinase
VASAGALDVLVLEDSAFDAELLLEHLKVHLPAARCRLTEDEDGFVAELQRATPDLILSDFELRGFTGAQALQHALRLAPTTPFVFVSGVIGEDNAVELLKQGATDYVSKGRLGRLPLVVARALREVAERRAREAAVVALQAAKDEADRANQAKDRFLAMLSHELRTPLAPIVTAAHLLERSAQVPPQHAHLLPMIRRNVALEARLIDDLLDLTAISAGKLSLHLTRVDLHDVVRAVVDMVTEPLAAKALQLELALAAPQAEVQADAARLQQVVWNLLRNAIKFTPEGGHIRLATHVQAGHIALSCTDSGIGIAEAALPRIFMAFEQADSDVSHRYGGLGLGLAIARGLVLKHGGDLTAGSAGRDQGATFTVTLPLAAAVDAADAADASATAQAADGPAVPASTGAGAHATAATTAASSPLPLPGPPAGRLLLVEDNPDAAEALALSLQSYGYDVTHVPTRSAGLAAARDSRFDAVVTDLGLPDGSGIELGRALAGRLPVIALSGYGTAEDRRLSQDAGFSGHLIKPVDPEAVHRAVQSALGGAAAPRA